MAEFWDCTDEEYFGQADYLASHMLQMFRQNPMRFYRVYVEKSEERGGSTHAMDVGTAFHTLVLEPDRWEDYVAIGPEMGLKTKGWAEFESGEEAAGRACILPSEELMVKGMAQAVRRHEKAYEYLFGRLANRHVERVARMTDPATGVGLKCKFDVLWDDGVQADLKSSKSAHPESFSKDIATYGYNVQQAVYRRVSAALLGKDRIEHVWVVCEKEPPYDVAVYELDPEDHELADGVVQETLERFRECRELDYWANPWTRGKNTISMPGWSRRRIAMP